ncbi:MAG: DUF2490 domain-containing protein [Candidatus Omnitrophota bacterium]
MRKYRVKVLAAGVFLWAAAAEGYAYDNGDFQIWHTENQEAGIGKGTKLTQEEEWRFGEDASELYYQHYDWGVVYGFDKRLDIGFNYRQVYERYKQKWREENRPHVSATVKLDLWKFKFEDRNRLEYRHFRYKDDFIRYRNKFALKYPIDLKKIKITPYISDEIFIVSNSAGFNENRFYAGMELGLAKYLKFDVYYLLRENRIRADKWSSSNILGTKLKIAF